MIQRVPIQGSASVTNNVRRTMTTMLTMTTMSLLLQDGKQNTLSCLNPAALTREIQTQVSARRIMAANATLLYNTIDESRYLLGCGGER